MTAKAQHSQALGEKKSQNVSHLRCLYLHIMYYNNLKQRKIQIKLVYNNYFEKYILGIYWPNRILNYELWRKTCAWPVSLEEKHCRWRWIGHICRMPLIAIPRVAMRWTPDGGKKGGKKGGRPKETIIYRGDRLSGR